MRNWLNTQIHFLLELLTFALLIRRLYILWVHNAIAKVNLEYEAYQAADYFIHQVWLHPRHTHVIDAATPFAKNKHPEMYYLRFFRYLIKVNPGSRYVQITGPFVPFFDLSFNERLCVSCRVISHNRVVFLFDTGVYDHDQN